MSHKSSCEVCGDEKPRDELIKYIPGGMRCAGCEPEWVE